MKITKKIKVAGIPLFAILFLTLLITACDQTEKAESVFNPLVSTYSQAETTTAVESDTSVQTSSATTVTVTSATIKTTVATTTTTATTESTTAQPTPAPVITTEAAITPPPPPPPPPPEPPPPPPPPEPPPPEQPNPGNGAFQDAEAREILNLVNNERAAAGLHALHWDESFATTAKIRSTELIAHFAADHKRPDGKEWHTVIKEAGIPYSSIGENMAKGSPASWYSAQIVMNSWMESPGHRDNIMKEDYTVLGVAAFDIDGTRYYVQHFGAYHQ
ncbi:MAG: CAP domain-containing protein [Oscillospiraceae bacterium]|nr:CAP domain-containing protein [Oscillospiraceae bacterium]